jgi:nicotinamide-nucleotide amidase
MSDPLTTLATLVGTRLNTRGFLLATAESCTGGWAAQAVTAVAGSSAWFDRGFITYSNEAKREMLGVPSGILAQFGAVSEETAREMAAGALEHSRAHVSLSITGVAGPSGGTPDKPVGMVCFGWARRDSGVETATRRLEGDRESIRRQAVMLALAGVMERLDR